MSANFVLLSPIQYVRGSKPGNDQQSKTGSGQVYALQSRFGTRFCKFVDSAGNQATPEMVNQAMPILKNCIAQLPKGLSTVTISVTTPEKTAPLGITAAQQRPSVSTARPAPKPENVQQKISEAPHTYTIVNPPGKTIVYLVVIYLRWLQTIPRFLLHYFVFSFDF